MTDRILHEVPEDPMFALMAPHGALELAPGHWMALNEHEALADALESYLPPE